MELMPCTCGRWTGEGLHHDYIFESLLGDAMGGAYCCEYCGMRAPSADYGDIYDAYQKRREADESADAWDDILNLASQRWNEIFTKLARLAYLEAMLEFESKPVSRL